VSGRAFAIERPEPRKIRRVDDSVRVEISTAQSVNNDYHASAG
jgi:hypothetical protein